MRNTVSTTLTATGVSICEATDSGVQGKQSEVIRDWPSRHSKIGTNDKVPSEIAYLPGGIEWGANIAPNAQREMWTKLQLDRPQTGEAGRILRELSSNTQGPRRRPVDIIADFLERVRDHLITNLDNQYGPELWRTLPITLVVTVPAVWSDLAKARTMQAVNQAGFNSVRLPNLKHILTTTEPEAAAIYTIKTLRGGAQDDQLVVGDGLIVCDMGGGTVDLISYKVSKLQPTMVQEATVGNGDQCGGTFVDRAFFVWLQNKLGIEDFKKISGESLAADIPRTSISPKLGRMLSDFIVEAKNGFSGKQDNYLRLPHPPSSLDDDARGICNGEIEITS